MSLPGASVDELRNAIRDSSIPATEDLLTSDLSVDIIPRLLESTSRTRDELSDEIRDIGRGQAGDVENWIAQAKKVQEDIARCKLEARRVVADHEKLEQLRSISQDSKVRVELLEAEIAFNKALEHEIESVGEIFQVLQEAEDDLGKQQLASCVSRLISARTAIAYISARQTRSLLETLERDLRQKTQARLQTELERCWIVQRQNDSIALSLARPTPVTADVSSIDSILSCLDQLGVLPIASAITLGKLETFFRPAFVGRAASHISASVLDDDKVIITLGASELNILTMLDAFERALRFLHSCMPEAIAGSVSQQLLPGIVSRFISGRLDSTVPLQLDHLDQFKPVQLKVKTVAQLLAEFSWPGFEQLYGWIERIPRLWLARRRAESLDVVRQAFASANGTLRQVEREERQTIRRDDLRSKNSTDDVDDWSADWGEANPANEKPADTTRDKVGSEDEEASGWDFETEDDASSSGNQKTTAEGEEEGDAWGWGDESPVEDSKPQISPATQKGPNGIALPASKEDEVVVLTETYNITGIPDHILEIIGKDYADAVLLETSPGTYFTSSSLGAGLKALPTVVLAMFRAIAPNSYSTHRELSNMNLYNDTIYLTTALRANPDSALVSSLSSACDAMDKFARQTYTRELETQRTILSDLLDGAQGFVSCSRPPYRQECDNAVDAVNHRIRQVYKEWSRVLGQSHLLQSIGGLIAMIMGKVIRDVEDMEDISEADSKQLVSFCQRISSFEDLFLAKAPENDGQSTAEPISAIAVYVPNYLRFQYLQQILDSSLVDIKYLWTEGELSLEFEAEEVVDFIQALFAESSQRRSAIQAIKAPR